MHRARNVYPSDEKSLQFLKEMSLLKVTWVDIFPGSFRLSIFSNGCRRLKVTICIRRPYSNACHDLTGCLNHSQERWKTWKPLIHQTWTVRQIKEKAIALEFWIKRIDLFIHFIVKLCIVYDEIKDSELSMKIHQIEDLSFFSYNFLFDGNVITSFHHEFGDSIHLLFLTFPFHLRLIKQDGPTGILVLF